MMRRKVIKIYAIYFQSFRVSSSYWIVIRMG